MNPSHALRQQIECHLAGQIVWQDRDHVHLHDGLSQAIRRSSLAEQAVFAEALCPLLGSPDSRYRTGAIAVLNDVMPPLCSDQALAYLEPLPTLPPAWNIGYPSLEQAAAIALATKATPDDRQTIQWLKNLVLQRDYADFLWVHIARLDPDWLLQQSHQVGHQVLGVITALPTARRGAYIAAKAPWPPEVPNVLTRAFWRKLHASERQRLRSLMYPQQQTNDAHDAQPNPAQIEPDVFSYQIGSEYAPDAALGLETIRLIAGGLLLYERKQHGQSWQQQMNVASHLQETLKTALTEAKLASPDPMQIPPGASLVKICSADQQVCIDYFQGQKLPGYAQIIQMMDAYLQEFRAQQI